MIAQRLIGNKKLFVALAGLLVGGYLFFVFVVFNLLSPKTAPSLSQDYSKLNMVKPGKSTIADVEKINGTPARTTSAQEGTYLYYSTPLAGQENKLLFTNGVLVYADENIYGDYRGKLSDFTANNGQSDFKLYNLPNNQYPWSVYLAKGIMISSSNDNITEIVYFTPQDKQSFFKTIGAYLGFTESNLQESGQGESFGPPQ